MLVFLVLNVIASCTNQWRRTILILMTLYFFKTGEFLSPFLCFAGALLAEVSLSIPRDSAGQQKISATYWPFGLMFISLILASSPPENPTFASYSRAMWTFFERYITTQGGISSAIETNSGQTDRTIGAFGGSFLVLAVFFLIRYGASFRTPYLSFWEVSHSPYIYYTGRSSVYH